MKRGIKNPPFLIFLLKTLKRVLLFDPFLSMYVCNVFYSGNVAPILDTSLSNVVKDIFFKKMRNR